MTKQPKGIVEWEKKFEKKFSLPPITDHLTVIKKRGWFFGKDIRIKLRTFINSLLQSQADKTGEEVIRFLEDEKITGDTNTWTAKESHEDLVFVKLLNSKLDVVINKLKKK